MKLTFVVSMVALLAVTQAQLNVDPAVGVKRSFAGLPPAQFFQEVVLQSEAQKLLTTPDLPEDLRQRVLDTMANAELGFSYCNTIGGLPWMQIRCTVMQLKVSKNEFKAIENEAIARAQAEAAAEAAEAAAAATAVAV